MLKPWRATESHEDIFLQRYDWLMGWALRLTGNDLQKAEDLVHDAFIQFTLARPVLQGIHNLEAYLYTMLRNLHLSDIRRNTRSPLRPANAVNFDSAEITLRAIDPRSQLKIRDELRCICQYACARKETSKAGSVLILRFFQGYYPGEIAEIMNAPRRAVDDWLRIARREFATYLPEPGQPVFPKDVSASKSLQESSDSLPGFLAELRRMIYASRQGNCLPTEELKSLYKSADSTPIECATLGHIVSCAHCLEEVNRLLTLPSLSDRFPPDMLGPDQRSKFRDVSRKTSEGSNNLATKNCYRRARDVFEHAPEELHLSVNGYIIGSQKVGANLNEQTIAVTMSEKIGFVEVFSEQGIRLLFLMIEPPPDGEAEQSLYISLSEERALTATLRFHDTWPSLYVAYRAPQFNAELASSQLEVAESLLPARNENRQQPAEPRSININSDVSSWRKRLLEMLSGWMRPIPVTAMLALVLVAILVFLRLSPTPISASELLRKSGDSETALLARPNFIVHRLLDLEERRPDESVVISRHRVEIWAAGNSGAKALRVYDNYDRLVIGEWTAEDGTRIMYRMPDAMTFGVPRVPASLPGIPEELWRMEPSAKAFSQLVPDVATAQIEEQSGVYYIRYQLSDVPKDGLIQASLKINKADLRAVEQVMIVRQGEQLREYRLIERDFRQPPTNSVEPKVFEPDPGLLLTKTVTEKSSAIKGTGSGETPIVAGAGHLSAEAMAELEVEALYQFHRTGACLYDQTEVTQATDGRLNIRAIVESNSRKNEMLQAFRELSTTQGVNVEILTVAEALQQQVKLPAKPLIGRRVEVPRGQIPADAELRKYFSSESGSTGGLESNALAEKILQFSNRVLNRSRKALLHASALQHLLNELPPQEMNRLNADAYAHWRLMLNAHTREVREETTANYRELAPVFFATLNANTSEDEVTITDVRQAVERLLQAALLNDKLIRQTLTISTEGVTMQPLQLRDSLKRTERLTTMVEK
jgi:RNA polymerase sigma factor (sigma-70 family)